jgi:hypothetical protein
MRMLALLELAGDKCRRGKALALHSPTSDLGLEQLALERGALAGLKRSDSRKIALDHVTSVSRYCSDKFKHRDLPRFTL